MIKSGRLKKNEGGKMNKDINYDLEERLWLTPSPLMGEGWGEGDY
jgi:hypothetical protein